MLQFLNVSYDDVFIHIWQDCNIGNRIFFYAGKVILTDKQKNDIYPNPKSPQHRNRVWKHWGGLHDKSHEATKLNLFHGSTICFSI